MPRRHPWLRRLGVLVAIGLGTIFGRLGGDGFNLGQVVGVVEVDGVITDAQTQLESLESLADDERVSAIVVRIDSPGGGVAPSQELYEEIERVKATKPVIASLGNVAASGGYYVAAAAHKIVADPGTLTGSIGVIMEFRQLGDLAE